MYNYNVFLVFAEGDGKMLEMLVRTVKREFDRSAGIYAPGRAALS